MSAPTKADRPTRWLISPARLGVAGLLALSLGLAAAAAPQRAASEGAERRAGAAALHNRCARCHGADGTGRPARGDLREIPDFSDHHWQASRSDAELFVSILDGKGSHMPPYRGKLSEKEARELVAQVRALDPAPSARPAAVRPADEFERRLRELEQELAELKKQFRETPAPPGKR
jgi:mono/diheme cytochrome c family protein